MDQGESIRRLIRHSKTIAVVGLSSKEQRAGYYVPAYLQEAGYRILPVNPNLDQALGEKAYPDLSSIQEPIDLVQIFRLSKSGQRGSGCSLVLCMRKLRRVLETQDLRWWWMRVWWSSIVKQHWIEILICFGWIKRGRDNSFHQLEWVHQAWSMEMQEGSASWLHKHRMDYRNR